MSDKPIIHEDTGLGISIDIYEISDDIHEAVITDDGGFDAAVFDPEQLPILINTINRVIDLWRDRKGKK